MKSSMIRIILFVSIYKFIIPGVYSQTAAQSLEIASEMQQNGNYEGAIRIYKRILFFDQSPQQKLSANLKLADCHTAMGNIDAALTNLNLAYYLTESSELQIDIQFRQITLMLLNQRFLNAQEELFLIEQDLDSAYADQFYLYQGIAWFGLASYDSARTYFHKFIGIGNTSTHQKLDEVFQQTRRIKAINPRKAQLMSTIIPGLGQFYAGDIKNGLNSLLLTSGLMVLGIHLALLTTPFDALLAVGPWFARYYQGGRKRAKTIAEKKKKQRKAQLYQQVLDTLETGHP